MSIRVENCEVGGIDGVEERETTVIVIVREPVFRMGVEVSDDDRIARRVVEKTIEVRHIISVTGGNWRDIYIVYGEREVSEV